MKEESARDVPRRNVGRRGGESEEIKVEGEAELIIDELDEDIDSRSGIGEDEPRHVVRFPQRTIQ